MIGYCRQPIKLELRVARGISQVLRQNALGRYTCYSATQEVTEMRLKAVVSLALSLLFVACARPESVSSIRRGCVVASSCATAGMGVPRSGGGVCYIQSAATIARGASPEQQYTLKCAREATNCTTFRSCTTRNHGVDYCTANRGESCDGNVRVSCPMVGPNTPPELIPPATTQDCALLGLVCSASNGNAACTNGMACDAMFMPTCDGTKIVTCDRSTMMQEPTDCARQTPGSTCVMLSVGGATVPTCLTSTMCMLEPGRASTRCETSSLISCVALPGAMPDPNGRREGREVRIDCAHEALEGRCAVVGGTSGCTSIQNQCAPDSPDRCNGNAVEICVNGRYESTDCGSIGFSRCAQLSFTTAVCVN